MTNVAEYHIINSKILDTIKRSDRELPLISRHREPPAGERRRRDHGACSPLSVRLNPLFMAAVGSRRVLSVIQRPHCRMREKRLFFIEGSNKSGTAEVVKPSSLKKTEVFCLPRFPFSFFTRPAVCHPAVHIAKQKGSLP